MHDLSKGMKISQYIRQPAVLKNDSVWKESQTHISILFFNKMNSSGCFHILHFMARLVHSNKAINWAHCSALPEPYSIINKRKGKSLIIKSGRLEKWLLKFKEVQVAFAENHLYKEDL